MTYFWLPSRRRRHLAFLTGPSSNAHLTPFGLQIFFGSSFHFFFVYNVVFPSSFPLSTRLPKALPLLFALPFESPLWSYDLLLFEVSSLLSLSVIVPHVRKCYPIPSSLSDHCFFFYLRMADEFFAFALWRTLSMRDLLCLFSSFCSLSPSPGPPPLHFSSETPHFLSCPPFSPFDVGPRLS